MPRIIGKTLEEHRAEIQRRIFDAFTTLLIERGYAEISLADIAQASDIGRSAMYNYYADKETLLLAYVSHETERYRGELLAALAKVTNPITKLQTYISMQLTEIASQHISMGSMSGVLSESGRLAARAHVLPLIEVLSNILASAVDEGYLPDGDLSARLSLVSSTINGRNTTDLTGERLERAIQLTTEFVLRGLQIELDDNAEPRRLKAPSADQLLAQ